MMNWTDAVQAICAIISTIGGIGALGVSAWQIYLASKQMRETSKQSKQESEDRNRPYISMDVVPGLGGVGCWDLKISNTGGSPARDISISLLHDHFLSDEDGSYLKEKLEAFCSTQFDLMPGASRRIYWSIYSADESRVLEGAPLKGVISARYSWKNDSKIIADYEDNLPYDCENAPIPAPSTGSKREGKFEAESLKNIEYALRSISHQIGELAR